MSGLRQAAAKREAPRMPAVAPEVMRAPLDGSAWRVREGSGSVNMHDGEMRVPLEDSAEARHVRIHELLHARVTPPDLLDRAREAGVSPLAVQTSEDGRLGAVARWQGIGAYNDTAPIPVKRARAMVTAMIDAEDWHGAACMAVAATNTALEKPIRLVLKKIPDAAMATAVAITVRDARSALSASDGASAIAAARILDVLLPPGDGPGESDANDDAMSGSGERPTGPAEPNGCKADPAGVSVIRPPLVMRGSAKRQATRRRSPDSGALTRPSETLDPLGGGRPFTRKVKQAAGVVVIDTSGSMHPTHEGVRALVEAAPGAMILTYSSEREEDGRVKVYVVGAGGRVCAPDQLRIGGGNVNDASVLAWAAKHGPAGPRVWVSDGIAGNAAGHIDAGAIAFTGHTAKRLGFLIVGSLAEALA